MANRTPQLDDDKDGFTDYSMDRKEYRRSRQKKKKTKTKKANNNHTDNTNEDDDLSYEEFFRR